ncbi:hypothetical protein FSARC_14340 [Fusarium sarcochroum]|uniref:Heterokaryon incompatibility domain-containing protein n=1 Tax=Fusarium sarcochroum TaxID=1208366 RepID=A0A8H4SUD8_9HYPO|nr:hypothetical protein FSARC_14340 [Fusarium sarcochroum]
MSSLESPSLYNALPRDSPWVRVLVLHPGSLSDPIAITLSSEKFDDSCEFEALSCTWGSLENTETIIVNDNREGQVTHNLASPLRHLRLLNEGRRLWIDAICFNQQDIDERGYQVSMMHPIFQRAKTVQVWLGPAADGSELAVQTLDYIGSSVQVACRWGDENSFILVPQDTSNSAQALVDRITRPQFPEETWRAIDDLLNRSWFKRLWARQEIQHANHLFYNAIHENSVEGRFNGPDEISGLIDPLSTSDSPGAINVNCGSSTIS